MTEIKKKIENILLDDMIRRANEYPYSCFKPHTMFGFNKEEKDPWLEYIKYNNLSPDIATNTINRFREIPYNDLNENERKILALLAECENNEDNEMKDYKDLEYKIEMTNLKIDNTNKIISVVGGVLGVLMTVTIFGTNAKFDAINSSINSKFELIQQQLESQKEINQLNIEKNVSQEFLKHKR